LCLFHERAKSTTNEKALILDRPSIDLIRVARGMILEQNTGARSLGLIGVPLGGVNLAKRPAEKIKTIEGADDAVGGLDATRDHDDLVRKISILTEQGLLPRWRRVTGHWHEQCAKMSHNRSCAIKLPAGQVAVSARRRGFFFLTSCRPSLFL
jgi:hypothetical protein